jgi:hypothetical protein
MPIRITQLRMEALRQGANPAARATQLAVETISQPAQTNQQRMIVTQIVIEFPFTNTSNIPPPPGTPPTPTQGDTPPTQCAPPPTMLCAVEPDIRAIPETCELLGS